MNHTFSPKRNAKKKKTQNKTLHDLHRSERTNQKGNTPSLGMRWPVVWIGAVKSHDSSAVACQLCTYRHRDLVAFVFAFYRSPLHIVLRGQLGLDQIGPVATRTPRRSRSETRPTEVSLWEGAASSLCLVASLDALSACTVTVHPQIKSGRDVITQPERGGGCSVWAALFSPSALIQQVFSHF